MFTVIVASSKGGSGKTTLTDQLIWGIEFLYPKIKVAFRNIDTQEGVWHNSVDKLSEEDIQIVDTGGHLHTDFEKWCSQADIVLMPVQPSTYDLKPFIASYNKVLKVTPNEKVGVVINRCSPRFVVDREFIDLLKKLNIPVWGMLPNASAFSKSTAKGIGVHEIDEKSKAWQSVKTLVIKVIEESGING